MPTTPATEKRKGRLRRARRAEARAAGRVVVKQAIAAPPVVTRPGDLVRRAGGVSKMAATASPAIRDTYRWTTRDGRRLLLKEFETAHLQATIDMLRNERSGVQAGIRALRIGTTFPPREVIEPVVKQSAQRCALILLMESEMKRRNPLYVKERERLGIQPTAPTRMEVLAVPSLAEFRPV